MNCLARGEQTLDVEAVHGTAPGAHILFGGARSCLNTDLESALRNVDFNESFVGPGHKRVEER